MLPQYERFALHELMMHLSKFVFLIILIFDDRFYKNQFFLFLNRVASHAPTNNMKADNLAIVIGPNILKSPVSHHIPTVLRTNVVVARVCVCRIR